MSQNPRCLRVGNLKAEISSVYKKLLGIPTGRVPTSKHCTNHFFEMKHCLKKQCKTNIFSLFIKMLFLYAREKSKLVKAQHAQYKKHL